MTEYSTYYDLEVQKIVAEIKKNCFKKIVLQFPDGLKYYSKDVVDELKKKVNENDVNFFVYFGSCFGACDIPLHLKELDFDLCVQWGHAPYIKKKDMW